jgi:hypothetical protein
VTRDRKSAFRSSIRAEEQAVDSRFERAETVLARGGRKARQPEPAAAPAAAAAKVVRDSFSMPEDEYETIGKAQKRLIKKELVANKSQVVRMAFALLNRVDDKELVRLFEALPEVRAGRRPGK